MHLPPRPPAPPDSPASALADPQALAIARRFRLAGDGLASQLLQSAVRAYLLSQQGRPS